MYGYVGNKSIGWVDKFGLMELPPSTRGICCDEYGNKVEYDVTTHCCEGKGMVVPKETIYIINRSEGKEDTGKTGGHIDLLLPDIGLVGFFGIPSEASDWGNRINDSIGICLAGVVNNSLDEWIYGPAKRPAYAVGEGRTIDGTFVAGYLSTICELKVCPGQSANMRANITKMVSKPGWFNAPGDNCSTRGMETLACGGVLLDEGMDNPQNIINEVKKLGAKCYLGYTSIDPVTGKSSVIPATTPGGAAPGRSCSSCK
jgi:hypothetical protein